MRKGAFDGWIPAKRCKIPIQNITEVIYSKQEKYYRGASRVHHSDRNTIYFKLDTGKYIDCDGYSSLFSKQKSTQRTLEIVEKLNELI